MATAGAGVSATGRAAVGGQENALTAVEAGFGRGEATGAETDVALGEGVTEGIGAAVAAALGEDPAAETDVALSGGGAFEAGAGAHATKSPTIISTAATRARPSPRTSRAAIRARAEGRPARPVRGAPR
ncbi:MAG: hypothetical protein KGK34_13495 [Chloroflexota bacterium]|nr:hypothetical protein [Chloroflexota bacterium]